MIGQEQKPIEEILEYLDGKEKIVLVGCGGCATVFHTGGEPEVKEMADTLSSQYHPLITCQRKPWSSPSARLLLLRHGHG